MTDGTRINRTEEISVANGAATISISDNIDVEAVDVIGPITIPKSSVETSIDIQPGGAGAIKFIAIMCTPVAPAVVPSYVDMSFKVDDVATVIDLEGPMVLMTAGQVALLGDAANVLKFTNASITTNNAVQIVVGRTAIEEQQG